MSNTNSLTKRLTVLLVALIALVPAMAPSAQAPAPAQRIDAEYTALIKQHLTDPRISTELVDHLPASDKVPTPLKFLGRRSSRASPAYLTYAKDIHAYMKAVADAAPTRAKFWVDRPDRRRPRSDRARRSRARTRSRTSIATRPTCRR